MTLTDLKQIMPHASQTSIEMYWAHLNTYMAVYQVNTLARKACFISQLAHESGSLHYVKEIASGKAYEGRRDLGNNQPGDGVKFRGRGLIQITGRDNYMKCSRNLFGDELELVRHPERLEEPKYAVQSALWFWVDKSLNQLSDRVDPALPLVDSNLAAFKAVVKRVNGGVNGLPERMAFWERAVKVFKQIDIE